VAAGLIAIIIALNFAEWRNARATGRRTLRVRTGGVGRFRGVYRRLAALGRRSGGARRFSRRLRPVLHVFLPRLTTVEGVVIKVLFIASITYVNVRGTKMAGRANDVLTIAKLSPLLLLIVAGAILHGI